MKIKLAVAVASGFAVGFMVAKRMLEQTYIDAANEEVAKMEEALQVKEKLDDVADVLAAINDEREEDGIPPLGEPEEPNLSQKWATVPEAEVAEQVEHISYNKIVSHYDTETHKMEPSVPPQSRMVDEVEFFANPHEDSLQLTYYAGSNVLLDTKTREIVTQGTIIKYLGGFHTDAANFTPKPPHMLYIRADAVKLDIEVELDLGEPEEG